MSILAQVSGACDESVLDYGRVMSQRQNSSEQYKLISGIAALVQGILEHRRFDAERGYGTRSFVSGYRGSPLGNIDSELWRQSEALEANGVLFKPGLNEDLAATACWGTQRAPKMKGANVKGVSTFWYGKGPGVDRSCDALNHANLDGTHPLGGAVMLVGDDHGAKSSSTSHQSEQSLIACGIPVLNPCSIQEYIDLIPVAVELSRYAGLWIGFKVLTDTVESASLCRMGGPFPELVYPDMSEATQRALSETMASAPLNQERSLFEHRLPAAKAFVAANALDRVTHDAEARSLGIIAPGKAYTDVMEALTALNIDDKRREKLGIRIYRPLMTWPLEESAAIDFCRGHQEIIVIEEKRGLVEDQLLSILYHLDAKSRPPIRGKRTPEGLPLLPSHGEIRPLQVSRVIRQRLESLGLSRLFESGVSSRTADVIATEISALDDRLDHAPAAVRQPMYCSGCPHNRSTRHPEGTLAFGGIGCHGMAMWIPELETSGTTHMGAEGANWIGIEPYNDAEHLFQNMGDGTYAHSGSLAIRAAVASGSNITYKVLFNAATAMTGGQEVEGELSAANYAEQLIAEGCVRVALVSEAPEKHEAGLDSAIELHPRSKLNEVQEAFKSIEGVTAIVYDQGCAAERRRLRKRGKHPDPNVRAFIDPDVCEGCGDCGQKSTCVSILPLETELGRKRQIDQTSCNKDYTCLEGFCPSFVTVTGGTLVDHFSPTLLKDIERELVEPENVSTQDCFNILLAGIGGTGVISLGVTLASAAELEGKCVQNFDVTGLAQKNGAVYSHIRIFEGKNEGRYASRIPDEQLDVLVACDIVSATTGDVLKMLNPERSSVIFNEVLTPLASFQRHPDMSLSLTPHLNALKACLPEHRVAGIGDSKVASSILGSEVLMNIFVLGYAFQDQGMPFSADTLLKILSRRGDKNCFAFQLGRYAALHPGKIGTRLGVQPDVVPLASRSIDDIVDYATDVLKKYQNQRYADRYRALMGRVVDAGKSEELTRIVAVNLFKVMRYKDEYEVARLYSSGTFSENLAKSFTGDFKLTFHLAPPILSFLKSEHGEPKKIKFGGWTMSLFHVLAKLKFLRGTPFDPFGLFADRRMERKILREYLTDIELLLRESTQSENEATLELAALPSSIKGYGPVKERNYALARTRRQELLQTV